VGIDATTKDWIRNPSDELAAASGCRFDVGRAEHAVNWIQDFCYLYEGECAGQRMMLKDWQFEATMRLFGWVKYSEERGRELRRFRRASIFIPKKNAKSPTLAAWGLYLFAGDGEQGQKVFSTARDGKQAAISHTHAVEMVRRSPELMAECRINKTTGRITHEPTRSFYDIIHGDNIEGQEGLNGSILVDETHVVDSRLMKVLKYAGISRAEPMHIEVSTAGNNPDGYGKTQCDQGAMVAKGEICEEDLFYMHYGAPPDLTDSELDAKLVEYGKAANPSWGRLIRESEFVASYNAAKKSIGDMADFKMYRLNIWQRATNPWLKSSDWEQCRRDFTEEDLRGRTCVAGLDLSRVEDMTALGLVFPNDDGTYQVLCKLWLPHAYAHENKHLAPFLDWEKAGWLTITPGASMDFGFVRADIREWAEKFQIQELVFDATYAEETTAAISEGVMNNKGETIEAGLGIERIEFKQQILSFAKPTEDFEALVAEHKLHHNGNPVLAWMAGHCEVYRDANGNRRPIKPGKKKTSVKKIDGIVALVMALARADSAKGSIYEHRGLTIL
jgi:phage terminase large subunit-like protein